MLAKNGRSRMQPKIEKYWSIAAEELIKLLRTSRAGLTSYEASQRLRTYGRNVLAPVKRSTWPRILIAQYKSPIVLILIFAAAISLFLHDLIDASIILVIIAVSGLLGFWQEFRATDAVRRLVDLVQVKTTVLRDGHEMQVVAGDIVPGDVIIVSAGTNVPADCLLVEAKDLYVNEGALTGESYPADKSVGILPEETPLAQKRNVLFMGTNVASGIGRAIVIYTGKQTEFGKISERLQTRAQETEFERGLRRFGYYLMEVTLLLVVVIFAVNTYLSRPVLEAFLFSLALAVGLTPQLLPAIVSVNLAQGAREMAKEKVIVKRPSSIENFGSMNVLCSDKTGTLTEGRANLQAFIDANGHNSDKVLFYAYLNSSFESGFANPIDEAIRAYQQLDISSFAKLDEVPYDFVRKRLSILVSKGDERMIVTKGAVTNVLEICAAAELYDGTNVEILGIREQVKKFLEEFGKTGLRVLAVAYRHFDGQETITKDHEADMTLLGLLTFSDPAKEGVAQTVKELSKLGVSLKMVTGDNKHVAVHIGKQIGMGAAGLLTGAELRKMNDEALLHRVGKVHIFAEVEPNQKERIILALRKAGNVVGFMGDGINDATALHAADVGISVDQAVDVAKEAAEIVLLEKDLRVLLDGIRAGRKTFANTLKYVFMATSANFGNMFSMAGASLFLPFLPLLPKQILLTNLLTDLPEMAIATDSVDSEVVDKPRRWDIKVIRRFMLVFGLLSSVFDYLTFGCLLLFLNASQEQFRTAWFVESIVSATLIVLVIRTRRALNRSKPSRYLLIATVAVIAITLFLPFSPAKVILGFEPLPIRWLGVLAAIIVAYIGCAEIAKRLFYDRVRW
jgi:Mg2+-importing ATPase